MRRCPVRDTIMRRRAMDSKCECHSAIVPQQRVFRGCASNLASNKSLGHQHMGAVYHRGRSQIASTSESHGRDLIIQRYDRSDWRVRLLQCLYSLKETRQVRGQGRNCWENKDVLKQRRDFRGVINSLLSWRESVGRKRGRGGGECKGKLQVPRQAGRAEAKKLHKTDVDRLLIKIAESGRLRVDEEFLTKE
ncbi:hypothetical protein B296_00009282 [Ensete ventricosum]|uniref:Uncharacterized protein n=1 Tax=Ensete ventricosum TaxID=4639 RepID=A0A426ZPU1_ENSVE|nr:hypothetical protein B296_00009282 [Ensete ventricosum]